MNPPHDIAATVARALDEDVGTGDLTAAPIPAATQARAFVISRQPAVLCGCAWFNEVFRQLDAAVRIVWQIPDCQSLAAGKTICALTGPARALVTGERTALNFLQTLSATATATRAYVEAIEDTNAQILDTRKTIPGLRTAQKYAVSCGGGGSYRLGLFDAILIKENHIATTDSLMGVLRVAREHPYVRTEVEVERLEQIGEVLTVGADVILLDNFALEDLRKAVKMTDRRARLEASGGVTLHNVRAVAATGVDYISVGGLTKDLQAIDLSMRIEMT